MSPCRMPPRRRPLRHGGAHRVEHPQAVPGAGVQAGRQRPVGAEGQAADAEVGGLQAPGGRIRRLDAHPHPRIDGGEQRRRALEHRVFAQQEQLARGGGEDRRHGRGHQVRSAAEAAGAGLLHPGDGGQRACHRGRIRRRAQRLHLRAGVDREVDRDAARAQLAHGVDGGHGRGVPVDQRRPAGEHQRVQLEAAVFGQFADPGEIAGGDRRAHVGEILFRGVGPRRVEGGAGGAAAHPGGRGDALRLPRGDRHDHRQRPVGGVQNRFRERVAAVGRRPGVQFHEAAEDRACRRPGTAPGQDRQLLGGGIDAGGRAGGHGEGGEPGGGGRQTRPGGEVVGRGDGGGRTDAGALAHEVEHPARSPGVGALAVQLKLVLAARR